MRHYAAGTGQPRLRLSRHFPSSPHLNHPPQTPDSSFSSVDRSTRFFLHSFLTVLSLFCLPCFLNNYPINLNHLNFGPSQSSNSNYQWSTGLLTPVCSRISFLMKRITQNTLPPSLRPPKLPSLPSLPMLPPPLHQLPISS